MTPQKLKNSILQLAIQGKLVPQDPSEGTGEELYRQIQQEKAAMVKAGKIKKEKPMPEITEDEVPFEIPESWKWLNTEKFSIVVVGATPSTGNNKYWENGSIPWLPSGCCQDCIVSQDSPNIKYISQSGYESCSTVMMPADSVLVALTGATAGKVGLLRFKACGNQSVVGIEPFEGIDSKYIYYQLMARRKEILSDCVGSAQPHISKAYIIKMMFAIPPLAEQHRIVAKIESLLPYIDRYEQAYTRLETFNRRFPDDMRKSILQLAIQGRLVPQDPAEGTGEELYRQIQQEKAALVKAGKIKQEKPLPEITEDEVPFEIPEGWKWVRLGEVSDMLSGYAFKSEDFQKEGSVKLLRGINLGVGNVRWDDTVFLSDVPDRLKDYELFKGDVLLGLDRPWISEGIRVAIFDGIEETLLVQRVLRLRETFAMDNHYISLLLRSENFRNTVEAETTGISVPHISQKQVEMFPIPLPPLAEQRRIVARLEELLPLCDRLK